MVIGIVKGFLLKIYMIEDFLSGNLFIIVMTEIYWWGFSMKAEVTVLDVQLYDFFLYSSDSSTHEYYDSEYYFTDSGMNYDSLYPTDSILFVDEDENILEEFFNEE